MRHKSSTGKAGERAGDLNEAILYVKKTLESSSAGWHLRLALETIIAAIEKKSSHE